MTQGRSTLPVRDGTSRQGRALAGLARDALQIDDRDASKLLLFARDYASHLKYFSSLAEAGDLATEEDWAPFFDTDISVTLASIAALPTQEARATAAALRRHLVGVRSASTESRLGLEALLTLPMLLVRFADQRLGRLPAGDPLVAGAERALAAASPALQRVVAVAKGLLAAGLIRNRDLRLDALAPGVFVATTLHRSSSDLAQGLLSEHGAPELWVQTLQRSTLLRNADSWADFVSSQPADTTVLAGIADPVARLQATLRYGLFNQSLMRLFEVAEQIRAAASERLEASLESNPRHAPHIGLLLGFLELYQLQQRKLNELPERSLHHYYRDVLQLKPKGLEPSQAHLAFELARNARFGLVPRGTALDGKSPQGEPVSYTLDQDLVVYPTKVAALKAVRIDEGTVTVSDVVDSQDGMGEEELADGGSWQLFGERVQAGRGRLGLAVCDPDLFLRDSARTIRVVARFASEPPVSRLRFEPLLSGPEGWFAPTSIKVSRSPLSSRDLEIVLELSGGDPPVVAYDEELHARGLATSLPTLLLETGPFAIDLPRLEELTLSVAVNGSRNVSLRNDLGGLDPSKPFLPFGPQPAAGARFIVGSAEALGKTLESLSLSYDLEQGYDSGFYFRNVPASTYSLSCAVLRAGTWQPLDDNALLPRGGRLNIDFVTKGKFELSDQTLQAATASIDNAEKLESFDKRIDLTEQKGITLADLLVPVETKNTLTFQTLGGGGPRPTSQENPPFDNTSADGFLSLTLDDHFGHAQYAGELTRMVVEAATNEDGAKPNEDDYNYDGPVPRAPFTPKFQDLTLSYETRPKTPHQHVHLLPFGSTTAAAGSLLPTWDRAGELYIGLEGAQPPEKVTLLFRIADGTGNPLLDLPTVEWHALRGDVWEPIDSRSVEDTSRGLATTGVVGVGLPAGADQEHARMPSGLHWLRASVRSDVGAFNRVLEVLPQAAAATLRVAPGETPSLELEADVLTKLAQPINEIKKVAQPDPAFGGRSEEENSAFVVRASERLRHKNRAVTAEDWERLVLESFPQIQRARCINHSVLAESPGDSVGIVDAARPGSVLMVVVPRVDPGATNSATPRVRKSTLIEVRELLRARMSPFIELDVQNPRYEEVQVRLGVGFRPDILDIAFYLAQVNESLQGFFAPWTAPASAGEPELGAAIGKAEVIAFVEQLEYVDFVKDVALFHRPNVEIPDGSWPKVDRDRVVPSSLHGVLISHAMHELSHAE